MQTEDTYEIRGGSIGHIASAASLDVARLIADAAITKLGERIAVVWNTETYEATYRAVA